MKNSEAPGATNRNNPKRATRIPSTRTSPQGRVSPLLLADMPTLHLPRRLSTPSPHYGHATVIPASGQWDLMTYLSQQRILLPLFTNVLEGSFSELPLRQNSRKSA